MMHNPPHPGLLVKKALIDEPALTVTEAAKLLGVGRVTLSRLIHGKSGISSEMAVRLSIILDTSSELWMNMQSMYDLAQAEKKRKILQKKILKGKLSEVYEALHKNNLTHEKKDHIASKRIDTSK